MTRQILTISHAKRILFFAASLAAVLGTKKTDSVIDRGLDPEQMKRFVKAAKEKHKCHVQFSGQQLMVNHGQKKGGWKMLDWKMLYREAKQDSLKKAPVRLNRVRKSARKETPKKGGKPNKQCDTREKEMTEEERDLALGQTLLHALEGTESDLQPVEPLAEAKPCDEEEKAREHEAATAAEGNQRKSSSAPSAPMAQLREETAAREGGLPENTSFTVKGEPSVASSNGSTPSSQLGDEEAQKESENSPTSSSGLHTLTLEGETPVTEDEPSRSTSTDSPAEGKLTKLTTDPEKDPSDDAPAKGLEEQAVAIKVEEVKASEPLDQKNWFEEGDTVEMALFRWANGARDTSKPLPTDALGDTLIGWTAVRILKARDDSYDVIRFTNNQKCCAINPKYLRTQQFAKGDMVNIATLNGSKVTGWKPVQIKNVHSNGKYDAVWDNQITYSNIDPNKHLRPQEFAPPNPGKVEMALRNGKWAPVEIVNRNYYSGKWWYVIVPTFGIGEKKYGIDPRHLRPMRLQPEPLNLQPLQQAKPVPVEQAKSSEEEETRRVEEQKREQATRKSGSAAAPMSAVSVKSRTCTEEDKVATAPRLARRDPKSPYKVFTNAEEALKYEEIIMSHDARMFLLWKSASIEGRKFWSQIDAKHEWLVKYGDGEHLRSLRNALESGNTPYVSTRPRDNLWLYEPVFNRETEKGGWVMAPDFQPTDGNGPGRQRTRNSSGEKIYRVCFGSLEEYDATGGARMPDTEELMAKTALIDSCEQAFNEIQLAKKSKSN